ncbi:hypothetical protein [Viscerimonas tarda]
MKRNLLLTLVATFFVVSATAQTHFVKFEELYETIKAEAEAEGPAALSSGNKYLLNDDRVLGIFKIVSPSNRTARIDKADLKFTNGVETTVRLETNGASNTTNGRKIYIDCPSAGTLTVGGYNSSASELRGYKLEKEDGTAISEAAAALEAADTQAIVPQVYKITEAGIVVLNPNGGIYYGFLQFEASGSGVSSADAEKVEKSVSYYDLQGRVANENAKGVLIKKTTYTDGSVSTDKVIK